MLGRGFCRLLSVAVVVAMACAACGGSSKPQVSPSSQGFVPAPDVPTTTVASTTIPSPSAATAPTPTPLGTPDVQASAQANGCSVTPFAASSPPQVQATVYPHWYGKGDLWFAPPSIYAEFGMEQFANATVWFSGIVQTVILSNDDPTVSGHLHGDESTTLTTTAYQPNLFGAVRPEEPVHGVEVNLPQPGCWDLSVVSGGETLDVTAWVVPITQRPDVANLISARAAETAFPPPATCQVSDWNGPSYHDSSGVADYWISGQGITVDSTLGVFFATQTGYLDVFHDFPDAPTLTGHLVGDDNAVVRSSWIVRSTEFSPNGWRGQMTFSNPGCWQLQVKDGSASVEMTIYVYPADCLHTVDAPVPQTCKPPA